MASQLTHFLREAEIDDHDAETLIRLAASIIDDARLGESDPVSSALSSFSEPEEVRRLAQSVADRLYY